MEWSRKQITLLISLYRGKRELWDSSCEHYKNRKRKLSAWKEIAGALNSTYEAVEKKMKNLIFQFHREEKKAYQCSIAGDEEFSSKWYFYKPLLFLKGKNRCKAPNHHQLNYYTGPNGQETTTESNNATTSAAGFLPPVEATENSCPAQKTPPDDFLWNPLSHTSAEQNTTDAESCHESNKNNAADFADGFSGVDNTDNRSGSEFFDSDRPAGVMSDTIELFGRYVSSILQQLPVTTSYTLQQKFINEAITAKLEYERENPSKSPQTTFLTTFNSGNHTVDSTRAIPLQPRISNSSEEEFSKANICKSKKSKRSKKTSDSSPNFMNEQPLSPSHIKQELVDDFEDQDEEIEKDDNSMKNCSRLIISEEDPGQVKQETQTSFELILCNDFVPEATADNGPIKLLQALRGEVKDKPLEIRRPSVNCDSFKTSDLRPHAINDSFKTSDLRPQAINDSIKTSDLRPHAINNSFKTSDLRPQAINDSIKTSDLRPHAINDSFKTSDLRPQSSNTHPGLKQMQSPKRLSEENANCTRLTLPLPLSAAPPMLYRFPDESLQKRPKLSPRLQENFTDQHVYFKS